jgi:cell fate (sporulation/competence/biofilm development) regulator YmcA (YheA/YmcA/DUF963 family)
MLKNDYINYLVKPLKQANSATVLEKPNLSLSPSEKKEISQLCKNKPLLLELIGASMQENLIKTQDIEGLKKLIMSTESDTNQRKFADIYDSNIFNEVFDNFTSETKKATIKLSLFQRPFTVADATEMLKQTKKESCFYLHALRDRHFLQERSSYKQRHVTYEMHPSINEFMKKKCDEEKYIDMFTDAKETFFNIFLKKSKQIAGLLEKDYVKAYSRIERERLNLELALEISFEMGFLYFSSDFSESSMIAGLFLILIPGPEREKLFRNWSVTAEKKGRFYIAYCISRYTCTSCLHISSPPPPPHFSSKIKQKFTIP